VKTINYLLIILIIIVFAFTCYAKDDKTTSACTILEEPVKIIIYNQGKETIITEEYKLYNIILKHISERLAKPECLDFTRYSMAETEEKKIKGSEIALEFIYNTPIKESFDIAGETVFFEYSNLLMPLTGKSNKEIFIRSNRKYFNMAVGTLTEPTDLKNLCK